MFFKSIAQIFQNVKIKKSDLSEKGFCYILTNENTN